jgi:hypothetical protein
MSMPNFCVPLLFARLSMRRTGLPINRKSFGSFSVTFFGTGILLARSASSP